MKKKLLCLLLAVLLLVSAIPLSVSAASPTSGTISSYGTKIADWELDGDTLIITGTGSYNSLPSYSSYSAAPWKDHATKIKKLVVSQDVYSFTTATSFNSTSLIYGLVNLKKIYTNKTIYSYSLPSGVTTATLAQWCGSTHTFGDDYVSAANGHQKVCTICGTKGAVEAHGNFTYEANWYGTAHDKICGYCEETVESGLPHNNKTVGSYTYDSNYHYINQVCKDCGYESSGSSQRHDYTNAAYVNDGAQHYQKCNTCDYKKYSSHSYNNSTNKCACGAEKHVHSWTATASGNKISAVCKGTTGTCEYNKNGGSLTINGNDTYTYNGEAPKFIIGGTINTGSSSDGYQTVEYYEKDGSDWEKLYSAPKVPGEYQIRLYLKNLDNAQYAYKNYKIVAGKFTASATDYIGEYDGSAHTILVNAPEGTTVYYSSSASGTYTAMASEYYGTAFSDAGEYTVYYKVVPNKNAEDFYTNSEVKGSAKVKITPADLNDYLNVNAEGLEVPFSRYDYSIIGSTYTDHSIKVTVSNKSYSGLPGNHSATVEYSVDGGATWSKTNPKFVDVGTYTVKYRISVQDMGRAASFDYELCKNFNTIEGEETVVITQADLPFEDLVGYRGPYTGTDIYALGYQDETSSGTVTWIPFTPWNHVFEYYKDLEYHFEWTDEAGNKRETVASKKDGWQGKDNWPNYLKQNVNEIKWNDKTLGHQIKVTIVDPKGNYKTQSFTYDVQIGPYGIRFADKTVPYDGEYHTVDGRTSVLRWTANDSLEFSLDGENWSDEKPEFKEVGVYEIYWRSKVDTNKDGQISERNFDETREGVATLTITGLVLTVTANDNTITYGDEPAAAGYTVTGFVGGDDESIIEGEAEFEFSYEKGDGVGEYTITPKGLSLKEGSENYTFVYVPGKLTVEAKELEISWDKTEFVYNGSEQGPKATFTNALEGDDVTPIFAGVGVDAGDYTANVTAIDGLDAGNYVLPAETQTAFTIKKAAQNAPVVSGVDETVYNKKDGHINGLDTTMEYRAKGSEEWLPVTDPAMDLAPGTYEVRYPADKNHEASEASEAVIKAAEKLPQDPPVVSGIDETVYNKKDGHIKDLDEKMEYRPEGSEEWILVTDPNVDLAPGNYEVRYAESATHKASEATKVTINPAEKLPQDPPVVSGIDETQPNKKDGHIKGLDEKMEYRPEGSEEWIPVTDPNVDLAPGNYEVRYAETDTHKASEPAKVTINPAKETPVTGNNSHIRFFAFTWIFSSIALIAAVVLRNKRLFCR